MGPPSGSGGAMVPLQRLWEVGRPPGLVPCQGVEELRAAGCEHKRPTGGQEGPALLLAQQSGTFQNRLAGGRAPSSPRGGCAAVGASLMPPQEALVNYGAVFSVFSVRGSPACNLAEVRGHSERPLLHHLPGNVAHCSRMASSPAQSPAFARSLSLPAQHFTPYVPCAVCGGR